MHHQANTMKFLILPFFLALLFFSTTASANSHGSFLRCLSARIGNSGTFSDIVHARNSANYSDILNYDIYNLRFTEPSTPKPLVIVTPTQPSHVQATILCAKENDLQIRTRCAGHDFEGLSYVAHVPFVVIDLIRLRAIKVDVKNKVAWVQAGATLGEVYYSIAQQSNTLAFPAGFCPTVGVGGHISGGGYGGLVRKYGLAADHVLDAQIVDVNGRLLDRKSMGEDMFWAIRGGGGASFGVIVAWKLELVSVPPKVTVCSVNKTLEEGLANIFHKWQTVAPNLPSDLSIDLFVTRGNNTDNTTANGGFVVFYLGLIENLIPVLNDKLPELGITSSSCSEMRWIESVINLATFPSGTSLDLLLNRTLQIQKGYLKIKSDYVDQPISERDIEKILKRFVEVVPDQFVQMGLASYGGRMAEVPEDATPYAHRAGILYGLQYLVTWTEKSEEAAEEHLRWSRMFYEFMAPYVTKNPRQAYINYRDLDIGSNGEGYTSYEQAKVWGLKYFKNNFDRLVRIKSKVDPLNFFKTEQSIPALWS